MIDFEGSGVGDSAKRAREVLGELLGRRGLVVDEAAPLVLTVTGRERETGEVVEFKTFGGGKKSDPKFVREIELTLLGVLATSGGEEVWKSGTGQGRHALVLPDQRA